MPRFKLFVTIAVLTLTACTQKEIPKVVQPDPPVPVDIYITGDVQDGFGAYATYWKNGISTRLPDLAHNSVAFGIALSGTDVYNVGYVTEADGIYHACYWKNSMLIKLPDNSQGSEAAAVAISGNDIYIAGYIKSGAYKSAVYWKNGTIVKLPTTSANSGARAIAINGDDVYVAGYTAGAANHFNVTYWKNSTPVNIATTVGFSEATGIAVSGNDVYVSGNLNHHANYWKNGGVTKLDEDGYIASLANAIKIYGDDVFVSGCTANENDARIAIYWKNGKKQRVPDSHEISQEPTKLSVSEAQDIAVNNTDIYTTGYNLSWRGVYWLNGIPTQLSDGVSYTYNLVLVPK